MKAIDNSELAGFIDALPAPGDFRPTATYDPDGDCIEFLISPDDFHAERIDDLVTVYVGRESGELVGSLIKNIAGLKKRLSEKLPGFLIVVRDGKVSLEHLFLAALWSKEKPEAVQVATYNKLAKAAEEANAEAELSAV